MKGRFGSKQRIEHALEAISEIEDYIAGQTFTQFLENSMMRFACIKQPEVIGEACIHVDQTIKENYSSVEWRKIAGLRNLLIHEYFGIDMILVWDIIQYDLPALKNQLGTIILDI